MKDYSIKDILDKIIGHTYSIGESDFDEESLNNLETLGDIANYVIAKLRDNCYYINSCEGSRKVIAEQSYLILNDMISDCKNINEWYHKEV